MRVRIKNLIEDLLSLDIPLDNGTLIRELVELDETIEVADIDPYELNKDQLLRDLVEFGVIELEFIADLDDLIGIPSGGAVGGPGGGGGAATATTLLAFGRSANIVTGGSYLRTADGVPSDPASTPPVMPVNSVLVAASIGVDGVPVGTWSVDILVNGAVVATLSDPGTASVITDDALSVGVTKGDRISVRMGLGSATVARPVVTVVLHP